MLHPCCIRPPPHVPLRIRAERIAHIAVGGVVFVIVRGWGPAAALCSSARRGPRPWPMAPPAPSLMGTWGSRHGLYEVVVATSEVGGGGSKGGDG